MYESVDKKLVQNRKMPQELDKRQEATFTMLKPDCYQKLGTTRGHT